jgi:hypothetical protein
MHMYVYIYYDETLALAYRYRLPLKWSSSIVDWLVGLACGYHVISLSLCWGQLLMRHLS